MVKMAYRDMLYPLMRSLGVFRLDGSTVVDMELASYQRVLEEAGQAIDQLLRRLFIATADEAALAKWERLLAIPFRPGAGIAARRALILARLAATATAATPDGIAAALRGGGLEARITERFGEQALDIQCLGFLGDLGDIQDVKDYAERMLPVHLLWNFDHGSLTWTVFEGMFATWSAFDAADYLFIDLDTM